MNEKILIVEDQFVEANNLQIILQKAGYRIAGMARSVSVALQIIERDPPDIILLDIFLDGDLTGIDLAKKIRPKHIPFIYLSANSNTETLEAAKATRPYGFLIKPFRERDVLVMLEIAKYLHVHGIDSALRNKINKSPEYTESVDETDGNFFGIIGKSPKLLHLLSLLKLVAPTDTSVLILGENGTGKEKIADCIHRLSGRRNKPLIKVNCAALPATLIESILFGHEKGSFTGATERKIGKFEQANQGSLFLDEVGELPIEIQSRLLRALQEKEIERIGGAETIAVDVRMIVATNVNLEKAVAEGRFRMDLYYRLYVFPLFLPPLRERKEDIPLLVDYFIEKYTSRFQKANMTVSKTAMKNLTNHDWPGNIRELEHTIERSVLVNSGTIINDITFVTHSVETAPAPVKIKTMEEMEREHILSALDQCNGRIFGKNGAGVILGLNPSTLHSRMKKLGIDKYPGKIK